MAAAAAAQDEEPPNDAWLQSVIPVLPTPAATTCLVLNIAIPGSGTLAGGLCLCCCGTPRLNGEEVSGKCCGKHRVLMSVVSVLIGVSQFLTVIFCLVGWLWSIAWGVIMATLAGMGQDEAKKKQRARKSKMVKGKTSVKLSENDTTGQKNFKRLMLKVQETGGDIKPEVPPPINTGGKWKWRPRCWTERNKVHHRDNNHSSHPALALPAAGNLDKKPPKVTPVQVVTAEAPKTLDVKGLLSQKGSKPSSTAYFFKT